VRIEWSARANQDVYTIQSYIERQNISASYEAVDRITAAVKMLEEFPEIGRPGRIARTRELVVQKTPYIVVYNVRASAIGVVAVLHSAQRWPRSL